MEKTKRGIFIRAEAQCVSELVRRAEVFIGGNLEYEIRSAFLEEGKVKGVYLLMNEDGKLLYVGKSATLLNRLLQHIGGVKMLKGHSFSDLIYEIRLILFEENVSPIELSAIEKTFISHLKPAFNGGCGVSGSTMNPYGYESLYTKIGEGENLRGMICGWKTLGETLGDLDVI